LLPPGEREGKRKKAGKEGWKEDRRRGDKGEE